jgi:hypothetical protein
MRRVSALCVAVAALALLPSAASARVLRVGTFHGIPGQFTTIQAAIDAAHPGDWILVAPGDYKTTSARHPASRSDLFGAILITKKNLRLRGMNRSGVVVDGTKSGPACSRRRADQNFGPRGKDGRLGLNGIVVWKADNVWIENLTACNFLSGKGDAGNEIWWNGGDGSGKIGGRGFYGSYLTATSMYFAGKNSAAYGIFSSNWTGGRWDWTYASNFDDSGYYIGACQQLCHQTIDYGWGEYSAIGYSGTNSGGWLLVENSLFDHNEGGFDTNSENNGDWPSPQNGACPKGVKPPIAGVGSCWVLYNNVFRDNNNPNVPAVGIASAEPVGTGVSDEGRNDAFFHNRFVDNGAWGAAFQPFPDTGTPPSNAVPCVGGLENFSVFGFSIACFYDDWGNELIDNTFTHNGFFGNPSNGDIAESTFVAGQLINCYRGNHDTSGTVTTSPTNLLQTNGTCGQISTSADQNQTFSFEALCDTQILGAGIGCSKTDRYPRRTHVVMHPLPRLKTMPNPCAGVPVNPWCPAHKSPDVATT